MALASLILVLPEMGWAAPTKLISYQGRITDNNGQPIANGPYSIRFRLFTNLTDCNADTPLTDPPLKWTETQATVQVTNGLFSVVLASVTAFGAGVTFDEDYWLQVKVAANPVFTPCDRLTTAPFAIRSIDANAAANSSACNADATCETTALQINNASTVLTQGGGNAVRITTNSGYVEVGPQNTSWSHFITDRTQFYFNKQVGVDGDLFPYTDNTRSLGTSGGRWATLYANEVGWGSSQTRTQTRDDAGALGGKSGFYETSLPAPAADWPAGASSWWHLLDVRHSNTANNYAMQFSGGFFDQNLYFRKTNNAATTAWKQVAMTDTPVDNARACSFDGICEVQTVDSGQGSTEVHLMNQNIRTSDNVSFGTVTATGEVLAPAFRAPSAGYGSGAALDVGDVAVDYPGNAGWAATWNSNILLSGLNSSSISFHDSGLRVDTLRVAGGTFYMGENVGWGTANLSVGGAITTPGYVSITGASDGSGNLRFSAANPYIVASSYFVAPGGAYFNSGTVYTEAAIQARGGINDDGASAKLDLIDADGVNITAGPLFMAGTPFCTLVDIPDVTSGTRDTQCPVGWKAVTYYAQGTGYFCGGAVSHGSAWTDYSVRGYCSGHSGNCVGVNLNAGDNCFYGNILCCWAS